MNNLIILNRDIDISNDEPRAEHDICHNTIDMMTVLEAQHILGVDSEELVALVNEGHLGAYRIGPFIRFKKAEIFGYVGLNTVAAQPAIGSHFSLVNSEATQYRPFLPAAA